MAYGAIDRFFMGSAVCDAALATAIAVEAAAADTHVYTILETIVVVEFRVLITVTIDYDTMTTAAVVALDHRVAYGSDTGRVELATITIPQATAAGKQLYKKITPKKIKAGEQLVVEVKVQGAGGTEVGDWQPVIVYSPAPETNANALGLVASA